MFTVAAFASLAFGGTPKDRRPSGVTTSALSKKNCGNPLKIQPEISAKTSKNLPVFRFFLIPFVHSSSIDILCGFAILAVQMPSGRPRFGGDKKRKAVKACL